MVMVECGDSISLLAASTGGVWDGGHRQFRSGRRTGSAEGWLPLVLMASGCPRRKAVFHLVGPVTGAGWGVRAVLLASPRADRAGDVCSPRCHPEVSVGGGTERWYTTGQTMVVMGVWKRGAKLIVGSNHEVRAVVILLKALRHVRSRGDGELRWEVLSLSDRGLARHLPAVLLVL